ncbi:MAG: hypothetical protein ACQESF_02370 [Nanobdellota archaeon]
MKSWVVLLLLSVAFVLPVYAAIPGMDLNEHYCMYLDSTDYTQEDLVEDLINICEECNSPPLERGSLSYYAKDSNRESYNKIKEGFLEYHKDSKESLSKDSDYELVTYSLQDGGDAVLSSKEYIMKNTYKGDLRISKIEFLCSASNQDYIKYSISREDETLGSIESNAHEMLNQLKKLGFCGGESVYKCNDDNNIASNGDSEINIQDDSKSDSLVDKPLPEIHCNDNILNYDEEAVDCGGSCPECEVVVVGREGDCGNKIKDNDEVGVDCGGSCNPCPVELRLGKSAFFF